MMSAKVSEMSKLKDRLRCPHMIKERSYTNRPCSKKPVDIKRSIRQLNSGETVVAGHAANQVIQEQERLWSRVMPQVKSFKSES